MTDLLLTLANQPAPAMAGGLPAGLPEDATVAQVSYAEHLWAVRNESLGAHRLDGSGDPEDFWELAARLAAAMDSSAGAVWHRSHAGDRLLRGSVKSDLSLDERLRLSPGEEAYLMPYGPIPEHSSLWMLPGQRAADSYGSWPAFQEHAGRRVALGGVQVKDRSRDVAWLMASWVSDGVVAEGGEVVLKATRAKHGIWKLPASSSVRSNASTLRSALGWSLVQLEGFPSAFLLQEYVPLEHEYRMFLVGGRPVTGAGCVEEFTPLYAGANPFDARTRRVRGVQFSLGEEELEAVELDEEMGPGAAGSPVEESPELVARYREAAAALAPKLPVEAVVVDFAHRPDRDEVVMVEANGLSNSGLYASQPSLVVEALLKTCGSPQS